MSLVEQLLDRSTSVCYGIAAVALGAIVLLMSLRIISRNLALELAGLQLYAQALGVWMVFIVAGALGWEQKHIEIDYVSKRLPNRIQPYHELSVQLINLLMCLIIVIGSLLAIQEYWTGTSPSVNIPMPIYYIPAVLGMSMLGVVYLLQVWAQVTTLIGVGDA